MDTTIKDVGQTAKSEIPRWADAWFRFSVGELHCPYCRHHAVEHILQAKQPYFFRPITFKEWMDPDTKATRFLSADGLVTIVTKEVVDDHADVIGVACRLCTEDLGTVQVLCFRRSIGIGELVGKPVDMPRFRFKDTEIAKTRD